MKKEDYTRDTNNKYRPVEKDNSNAGLYVGLVIVLAAFAVVIIGMLNLNNEKQGDQNNINIELPSLENKESGKSQDLDIDLSLPEGDTVIQTPGPVITPPVVIPQPDINIDDSEGDNKVEVDQEPTPPTSPTEQAEEESIVEAAPEEAQPSEDTSEDTSEVIPPSDEILN